MGDEIEPAMETPESQSDDSADQKAADRAEGADPYAEGDSRNEGEAKGGSGGGLEDPEDAKHDKFRDGKEQNRYGGSSGKAYHPTKRKG